MVSITKSMEKSFAKASLRKIFSEKKDVLDIGGGARIDSTRNNRKNENAELLKEFPGVNYRIIDAVPDYNPDYVGDIHTLPFENGSWDAVLCISVLEHVKEPKKAMHEIHRVLRPGGYAFLYVPFLFYYHAEKGYYKDFFRFTRDGVLYLTEDFANVEMHNARGALGTIANLIPLFSKRTGVFDAIDRLIGKDDTMQTSGYAALCTK